MHHQIDLPDSAPQEAEDEPFDMSTDMHSMSVTLPHASRKVSWQCWQCATLSIYSYITGKRSYKDSSILLASYYHYFKSGACKQFMQVNSEVFVNIPSDFNELSHL